MKTHKWIFIAALLLLILLLIGIFLYGNREELPQLITKDVYLENSQGSFTKAQLIIPSDYKEKKYPLVTLSHGFRGSMNTAGGDELALNLAKAGFATIRMDFSHYTSENGDEQTNEYTVSTMISDQLLCIKYMISNYHIDQSRIGLYGRSLGGRVAMIMANESSGGFDYKALALIAPAGNEDALQYYMGGEKIWQQMKETAEREGSILHQKVVLTPEFFSSVEENIPTETAYLYKYPVLVIYNTEDYVVLPETSLTCAHSYENVEIVKVTSSKSPHGYEMSFKNSKLKEQLTKKIIAHFQENL